jgi:hypothetical protein
MILFYDTEKNRKVNFIRHMKVYGFLWLSMSVTLQAALFTYPLNYTDFPLLTSGLLGGFITQGIIYGAGLIYFYMGFQVMSDRLQSMYFKKAQFNMLLFIVKNYLYYMIPVCYVTITVVFVLPFVGDGPIYAAVMDQFFLTPCNNYWWTNVLLVSNFQPWGTQEMCSANISLISNEFWLIIVLIPLFGFVYKNYYRRALACWFFLIGVGASLIPLVYVSLAFNTDSYPGFMSNAYDNMMTKIYYRIPPFLIGIACAIFHFEFKYVDKLNDGSKPFHKDYLLRLARNTLSFKTSCYVAGLACVAAPMLL